MRKDVFLFDDHAMTREGMALLISRNSDWNVAGQAGSVREACAVIDAAAPAEGADCVVAFVDLSFVPGVIARQSLRALRRCCRG